MLNAHHSPLREPCDSRNFSHNQKGRVKNKTKSMKTNGLHCKSRICESPNFRMTPNRNRICLSNRISHFISHSVDCTCSSGIRNPGKSKSKPCSIECQDYSSKDMAIGSWIFCRYHSTYNSIQLATKQLKRGALKDISSNILIAFII